MDKFTPLSEIRTNHRYATYKGSLDEEPVFIKKVVDPELRNALTHEISGEEKMRNLDSQNKFYFTPKVLEQDSDYIVTEWVDGHLMVDDFESGDKDKINQHLEYLTNLYAFIDSQESTGIGITRFNQLNQETGVERISKKLKEFTYSQGIDWELVAKISAYITRVLPKTETRFTHGDLQPGNIMLTDNGQTYLIDFESCSDLWPRHYNIMNFIMNYGAKYPALRSDLDLMLASYCSMRGIDYEESKDTFGIAVAMRSLQMIYEWLSEQKRDGVLSPRLTKEQGDYLTIKLKDLEERFK